MRARSALALLPFLMLACGGSPDNGTNNPQQDSGTTSNGDDGGSTTADSGAVVQDSGTTAVQDSASQSVPDSGTIVVIQDSGALIVDSGTPDTGSTIVVVDSGTVTLDSGSSDLDAGVVDSASSQDSGSVSAPETGSSDDGGTDTDVGTVLPPPPVDGGTVQDGGAVQDSSVAQDSSITPPDAGTTNHQCNAAALFSFDNGNVSGWSTSIAYDSTGNLTASVTGTPTDGHTCPGAMVFQVNFTSYDQLAFVSTTFNPASTWANTLTLWVKVVIPSNDPNAYNALDSITPFYQWNNFSSSDLSHWFSVAPTFTDGQWHQLTVPLGQAAGQNINTLGIMVGTQQSQPSGGPNTPSPIMVYIDDITVQ